VDNIFVKIISSVATLIVHN